MSILIVLVPAALIGAITLIYFWPEKKKEEKAARAEEPATTTHRHSTYSRTTSRVGAREESTTRALRPRDSWGDTQVMNPALWPTHVSGGSMHDNCATGNDFSHDSGDSGGGCDGGGD